MRTYRTSDVRPEELERAIAERRVLYLREGARAYGSGDVWFEIGEERDLQDTSAEGMILAEPITAEVLAKWNDSSWDRAREFWEIHDRVELTWPCEKMSAEQRLQFKQAVTRLLADLLEMMPCTIAARAVPYIELLRLYAVDPRPELGERLVACAQASGWSSVLFDAERKWELEGLLKPVDPYLRKTLPESLGESMLGDGVAGGLVKDYDVWSAREWLTATVRCWVTNAAAAISLGEGEMPIPLAEMPKPSLFAQYRGPLQSELEQSLLQLGKTMSAEQSLRFQRFFVNDLARSLAFLPDVSSELSELLETARRWASELTPEILANADPLALQAAILGENGVFGEPFRLILLSDPFEIALRIGEARAQMGAIRFQTCTAGLEVRSNAEQEASEKARLASLEESRRYICRIMLPES